MPIELQEPFRALIPGAAVIGIIGLKGSGKGAAARAIAAQVPGSRVIALGEALNFSAAPLLVLDSAITCRDALVRERAAISVERLRRSGSTIILISHDEDLLRRLCDEIWWLSDGALRLKGDPREVLGAYRAFIAEQLTAWGRTLSEPLDLSTRRGDRQAEITALETLDASGSPSMVLRSGEQAAIRVEVLFREAVDKPVIGVMIRTRVGFEVYGTNTELEGIVIPPQTAGSSVRLHFVFPCTLCPGDYTVTAACHDPDGTPHDWLDDAVAFTVTDTRYTAGVANLRAQITLS